jgi:hypothetical protein
VPRNVLVECGGEGREEDMRVGSVVAPPAFAWRGVSEKKEKADSNGGWPHRLRQQIQARTYDHLSRGSMLGLVVGGLRRTHKRTPLTVPQRCTGPHGMQHHPGWRP